MTVVTIYMPLLDEGVDVWRPVQAELIQGNVYRILDQSYDPDIETWKFLPGERVIGEIIDSYNGQILTATRKAD